MDLVRVGMRIKNCRQALNLTQEKLAEMIDVSPHYIYEIERGSKTMSLYTLYDLSITLNVSTDYMLYGNELSNAQDNPAASPDRLALLVESIPTKKRDNVAHIISSILPYIK